MSNYNPDSFSHGCPDVTIGGTTYIVTSFSVSEPPVEVDFQTGKGAWRGTALEEGKKTGNMTIEVLDTDQSPPSLFETFQYEGYSFVVKQVDRTRNAGQASTYALQMNVAGEAAPTTPTT